MVRYLRIGALLACLLILSILLGGILTASNGYRAPRAVYVPASTATASAWSRPHLVNPVQITLNQSNVATLGHLDPNTDYDITCASGATTLTNGPTIYGGHNVIFENCDLAISGASGGASFKNQTGEIWAHDIHFAGSDLLEGIDLQEPGQVTVVIRDVLMDELHGSQNTNHADCIQTWAGPYRLLVDGLTCQSDYQGFFLLPNQNGGWQGTTEATWDFRHIDFTLAGAYGGWLGWVGAGATDSVDWNLDHVYMSETGGARLNPANQWVDVISGTPPNGHYVSPANWGAIGPNEPGGSQGANGAGEDPIPLLGEQQ